MSWIDRWRGLSLDPPGIPGWLSVLVALGLVAYAIWIYRRTDAPLTPGLRGGLAALRAGALLVLLLILCRPMLSLAVPGGADRGVAVLLDRSASMTLPGGRGGETRDDELRRAAATVQGELEASYPLAFRGFSGRIGEVLELPPPPPGGEVTDLGSALEQALTDGGPEGRPGALVMVTDGTATRGPDPVSLARRLGIPVHTVGVGRPDPVPDLAVTRVRVNREAFAGERSPIEVSLRLSGLESGAVRVEVRDVTDGDVPLAEAEATLDRDGAERRVRLTFTPTEVGLRFLEIRVPVLPGESAPGNNRRLVAVQVQKEKIGVLFLTGSLTWDHTFLRRALEADSTLSVVAGYWRGGRFRPVPGGKPLPSLDAAGLQETRVVVLDHVLPTQLGTGGAGALAGFVRGGGGLLLVTGAREGAISSLARGPLGDLLPVHPGQVGGQTEVQLRLTAAGRRHELFDPSMPGAVGLEGWSDMPPVVLPADLGPIKGNAEALFVNAGGGGNEAVLTGLRVGRGRVLCLAAGGIWRWDFRPASTGPASLGMPGWWRRVAHWLSRPDVETRLDIHPEEFVVSRGNPVTFVSRATDESFQPLPDVAVDLEILRAGSTEEPRTIELRGGEGFLSGVLGDLEPGRYRYVGRARSGDRALGTVEGAFAVDSLGVEMQRLEADHELLERLAAASGGRFWHPDSLQDLGEALRLAARDEEERVQHALWDHPALFALFVVLASLEWLLRRRRGLV